jgi:hypothetical protein
MQVSSDTHCAASDELTWALIDLPPGSKHKLSELRDMVRADPALQNLSEEDTKILLDGTQAWRDERRVGARPSNKSVAQDYRHAVKSINADVSCFIFHIYISSF